MLHRGDEKMKDIPEVGKTYIIFDDGKIKSSRKGETVISELIPFKDIDKEILEMWEEEVKQCFDIDLSHFKMNYDLCFVNCFDRLYVCDFLNKEIIDTINVDADHLLQIKKKALRKSHLH